MATSKVKDLAVSTGTYTDSAGQQKHRYVNVGGVFKTDDGNTFLLINRHINFAGLPFREGSESVIVSVFDLRDPNAQPTQQPARAARPAAAAQPAAAAAPAGGFDDDIPF
jgi:hypothetical protein